MSDEDYLSDEELGECGYQVHLRTEEQLIVIEVSEETLADDLFDLVYTKLFDDAPDGPKIQIVYQDYDEPVIGDIEVSEIFGKDRTPMIGVIIDDEMGTICAASLFQITVHSHREAGEDESDVDDEAEFIGQIMSNCTVENYIERLQEEDFLDPDVSYEVLDSNRKLIAEITQELCNFVDPGESCVLYFRPLPQEIDVRIECHVHPFLKKKKAFYIVNATDQSLVSEVIEILNLPGPVVMLAGDTCMRHSSKIGKYRAGKVTMKVKVLPDLEI